MTTDPGHLPPTSTALHAFMAAVGNVAVAHVNGGGELTLEAFGATLLPLSEETRAAAEAVELFLLENASNRVEGMTARGEWVDVSAEAVRRLLVAAKVREP